MHPELENLIDLAVVDGKVSEKEKEVLQRKAKELNVDLDELDMVLDAKLFIQNRDSQKNQSVPKVTETEVKSSAEQKNIKVTKFFNGGYKEYLKQIICKDKVIFSLNSEKYIPDYHPISISEKADNGEIKLIKGIDSTRFLNENISTRTYVLNGEFLLVIRLEELLYHKLFEEIDFIFKQLSANELEKDNIFIVKLFIDGKKEESIYELKKLINRNDSTTLDLFFAAYCFNSLFNNTVETLECVTKAMKAESAAEYIYELFETSLMVSDDNQQIKENILNLKSTKIESAVLWKEFFNDDREVIRCLTDIEKGLAKDDETGELWGKCALAWKWLLNDDLNSKKCLQKMEESLRSELKERSSFGDDMDTMLENVIAKTFKMLNRKLSYLTLPVLWTILFNDDSKAKSCLLIAKNKLEKEHWEDIEKTKKLLFIEDNPKTIPPKKQDSEGDIQNKIKNYLNLADTELQRINKNVLSRVFLSGSSKKDFTQVKYYLNEAIKLGSKEAENRLIELKRKK